MGSTTDNTEGYIKKIGSLSTQLRTITQTDLIIPNSDLITKSITNLTHRNKGLSRIQIKIHLLDNIKIELAKQLLLETTKKISDINQEPPNEPFVLYQLNSLTLWCVIDDIKNISTILSELNFNIMERFNKNDIQITFEFK